MILFDSVRLKRHRPLLESKNIHIFILGIRQFNFLISGNVCANHLYDLAIVTVNNYDLTNICSLIVLDEMDQLCNSKQSVLYSIFEWPALEDSRLVLIGIANALDLTDRLLPRLQARLALKPTVLHFPSYTRQQIIDIISDRLSQV